MKPNLSAALLVLAVVFFQLTGCAGSRARTDMGSADVRPATNGPVTTQNEPRDDLLTEEVSGTTPPPAASTASTQELSDDEALLLEDDLDWMEDRNEQIYTVADPLEPFNRAMFVLNDKLYFWLMKPVAQGYRAVVPTPARSGVKNFFYNLTAPIRIVNNVLQGKGEAAEAEWARFLYNSTVGVLGFGNPARNHPQLNPDEEDLGQTLAVYGLGDGFYLVLPFLGPSTLRDTTGFVGDMFLNPMAYVDSYEITTGAGALNQLNNLSFRIGDYEALKKAALDPYEAFRNAYIQLRQSKIRQ